MKKEINPFRLGLFVLSGVAIVIGTMIWIGALNLFQSTKKYVSYFDYSVDGLEPGTSVNHLGIAVGKISSVALARDGRLVRVIMKINSDFKVMANAAVEKKMAGLAGGSYLALVQAPENLREVTPKIDFPTEYPLIPAVKGTIAQIEDTLSGITEKVRNLNAQEVISSWAKVGKNANQLLTDPDIRQALGDLRVASASLRRLLNGIGQQATVNEIEQGIQNFAAASQSLRDAAASASGRIESIPPNTLSNLAQKLEQTARQTEQVVESTGDQLDQTLALLQQSVRQVNQVLATLDDLVQSLKQQPGRILEQPSTSEPFER